MKNLLLIAACWLIIIALASCKRLDGTTVVEGQVVDKSTGKAVPNAIVGVYSVGTSSMGGFNYKELEKQADGKGNFSFSFESDNSRDYALIASKDNTHASNYADPFILKEGHNNKKLRVEMQPYGWVRVMLVNVPPLDTISDLYVWGFDYENGKGAEEFHNLFDDRYFIKRIFGNYDSHIMSEIYRNGIKTKVDHPVYCPALDTVDVVIEY